MRQVTRPPPIPTNAVLDDYNPFSDQAAAPARQVTSDLIIGLKMRL